MTAQRLTVLETTINNFVVFYERRMRNNHDARIAESKKFFMHVLIDEKVVMDWNLIPFTRTVHGSLIWNTLIREIICFELPEFQAENYLNDCCC